jgi:hypothetical protein
MPEGVIVGGWSFVVAAYVVVGTGLALYSIFLIFRLRATRRGLAAQGGGSAGSGASRTPTASEPRRTEDSRR